MLLSMEPRGSTVIVTGASSGIGKALAQAFAEEGANVALASRNVQALNSVADAIGRERTLVVPTDVTRREQVDALVDRTLERFGKLDVLVNNAGIGLMGSVADLDPDKFRELFEVNLMGPLYGMQAAIRAMRQGGGGTIVNISSGTSRIVVPFLGGAYPALKRALEILSDYARAQLVNEKIRFLVVLPYITTTNFAANAMGRRTGPMPDFASRNLPPPHTPEFVAEKVIQALRSDATEISLAPSQQ